MRSRLFVPARLPVMGGCLALAAVGAACGGSSADGALAGKSPAQILAAASSAALKESGFHYVLQATGSSQTQTITGDAGVKEGVQTVASGSNQVEVEIVSGHAFLMGNAGGLQNTIGMPAASATKYAGKWISVATSDALYQPISQAVTMNGVLGQLKPQGTLSALAPGKIAGHSVIGVKGGLPGKSQAGVTGSTVLYVATANPTVPVGFDGEAKNGTQTVTDVGAFSHWGEKIALTAPTLAVPFSSIPTS